MALRSDGTVIEWGVLGDGQGRDPTGPSRIYDGPNPEASRQAAERNGLPVDTITKVAVLEPYF